MTYRTRYILTPLLALALTGAACGGSSEDPTEDAVLALSTLVVAAQQSAQRDSLPTVTAVDASRYLGLWYETYSLPQFFNTGCNCTTATYSLISEVAINVFNQCRLNSATGELNTISGLGRIEPGTGNAKLRVTFDPVELFGGDYWILALNENQPDYEYALEGAPNRGSLFILSRTRDLADSTEETLLALAESLGFDRSAVTQTNQTGCP